MSLRAHWRHYLLTLGVFVFALIPRVTRLGTFWETDGRYHWQLSNEFLQALLRRDWADTVPQGLPGLTLAWIDAIAMLLRYGLAWLATGGQASLEQIMAPDRPFSQLAQRQLPVVIVNTLIVVGIYLLARRLVGTKAVLLGVMFIALDPFFLAESRVLRFEALVAGLMPLSLLAALCYLKQRFSGQTGVKSEKFWLLSAVMAALAMLTKISALFLIPAVGLLGAAAIFSLNQEPPRPIPALALKYLFWIALVLFFFWLFWPAMWVAPLQTLQEVSRFVEEAGDDGFAGRGVFFWGRVYPDDPGYFFYPTTLLFRLTPLTLLGVVIALVGLAAISKQRWPVRDEPGWQWLGTALLLLYSLMFMGMMTLGAKKYDRYLMPIFPALDLVAGVGWLWLGQWLFRQRLQLKRPQLALAAGGLVLLGLQSLNTWPHWPYYYTYYNTLLGGARTAVHYVPVGYAEGLDQVAAYLEQQPNASSLKLASGNSSKLDGLFSGQTIALANLDGKWVQADKVLIYIAQLQRGKHAEDILAYLARHEAEYTLVLHGLEYAWLYPGPAAQYYGGGHKLEGRGTLFGYDLGKTELAAGESLPVTLYWRNEGQRPDDRFFVRLMDLDGYVWAEALAHPRPGFEAANRRENSIVESEARLDLPAGMPPGDYFFKPGFRTAGGQIIGYFELPGDTKPLRVTTPPVFPALESVAAGRPVHLVVAGELSLLGYEVEPKAASSGAEVWLTLYWRALADITHDYVILLRLLAGDQQEAAYWLGRPVRSGYSTTEWKAGQIVQDPWLLSLPPDKISPGNYQLEVALFDARTQAELARQVVGAVTVGASP